MATVTAALKDCKILEGNQDQGSVNTVKRVKAVLFVSNGATQVAGGTDTLDVAVDTLLGNVLRTGATITLRDWSVFQLAESSATAYAATGTVSNSTISLTPKTTAAWSANATISASAMVVPYGIFVICDLT